MTEPQFSSLEKLYEIEREIAIRERVYPNWIKVGRVSAARAQRQLDILRAIARDYHQQAAHKARET